MVNRVGGALELIGLRAVILDIRQYSNSGRQIEATNISIAKATEAAAVASAKSAQVTSKAMQAQAASAALAQKSITAAREYAVSQTQLASATQAVATAEAKLAAERRLASQARPRDATSGRFLSRDAINQRVTNAEGGVLASWLNRDAATASLNKNRAASIAWGKAQVAAANEATRASAKVVAADAAQVAANNKLQETQAKQEIQQAKRSKLVTGTVAIAGGLAAAAIGVASVGAAAKYQDTLVKINVLTNTTETETKQLGDSILAMTKKFPQSPDELGASAYFILSSGISDAAAAQKILEESAKDAAIGQGSVIDSAKALTAVIVSYGESNITAAQASDILVQAAKEGRAEFTDFAGAIGKTLPIAAAIGVTFDQVAAAMAVLTNGGLSAEEASTGLRAILNDLTKSSPEAEQALASIGKTSAGLRTEIKENLTKAMLGLIDAFKGNLAAIEPIIPNIRGLVAASSAFISQGGKVEGVLNNIQNASGVTNQSFEKASKTFNFQKDLLKNELNVALIQIGTSVLPTVTGALEDLVTWLDKNQEAVKHFISEGLNVAIEIIKDFASGIGLAIDALGWLPDNEQSIVLAVGAIGAAFAWALPGGPILKGLQLMVLLLGALSKEGGPGDKTAQKLNDFFGLGHDSGAGLLPQDVRVQVNKQGSVEKAIKALFGGNEFGDEIAKQMLAEFKSKGGDPTKGVEEFDRIVAKVNGTAQEATKVGLKPLVRNTDEVAKASDKAAKELKKLAEEFESGSKAAGQFGSFTKDFKKFGEINQEVAKAFNLDAVGAGNVQAADAIARSYERAADKGFEFTKTLATVAAAFQQSSSVARDIVLDLARSALDAAQKASSAILSNPTKEVANLGIPLALSKQKESALNLRLNPQIEALNKQLKSIDRAQRDLEKAAKQRDKQRKAAEEEHKRQQTEQNRILEDQLDAMRMAQLLARQAYERQAELLQDLIDANKKAQADLQAAFLKSNEDLQNQINKAIGQGSTQQALGLVEQQRAATKAFREQNKGLQGKEGELTQQQKDQARAEAERQRQAELEQAQLEAVQKLIKRQQEDSDAIFEHQNSTDSDTDAINAQKDALDNQRQVIQDQIDSLQNQKDAQASVTARIQEQIDLYESQTEILKAQAVAANKSLLTQEQQWQLSQKLNDQIRIASGAVVGLTTPMNDLIPEVKDSTLQINLLKGAVDILNGRIRSDLVPNGVDFAAIRLHILAVAAEDAVKSIANNGQASQRAADAIQRAAADILTTEAELENALRSAGSGGPTGHFYADGGFTPKTGGAIPATLHPNELILPLGKRARTAELLAQILPAGVGQAYASDTSHSNSEITVNLPPAIVSALAGRASGGVGSIFGDFSVRGATLEDMRNVAVSAVNDVFNQAASVSSRGGSLITPGSSGGGIGIGTSGGGGGAVLAPARANTGRGGILAGTS